MSIGNKRPPSGASDVGKRPAVDPRAEPQTSPPPPLEQRSATLPTGMAAVHKQLTSLQLQLVDAQRQIAQHQEERTIDTDRLAEMLKRLSRTELRARAAEAKLAEAAAQAAEAEQRAVELSTLEAEVLELRGAPRAAPEDATRSAALQAELDERAQRLVELETAAKRAASTVSTLEAEVLELRAGKTEALEAAELTAELTAALRSELREATLRLDDLETAAKGKDEELAGLLRDLNGALEMADAKAKQIETLVVEINGMQGNEADLIERARQATDEIARLAEVVAEVETLRNSVDEAGADNVRLEEELAAEKGRVEALEQGATELSSQHAQRLAALRSESDAQLAALRSESDAQLAALRSESDARHAAVTGELEASRSERAALEKKLEERELALEASRAEVLVLKTSVEEERAACEAAREDSTSLRALLNDAAAEIDNHSSAQRTVQENADKAAESLEALERAEAELILARQNVSQQVSALRNPRL